MTKEQANQQAIKMMSEANDATLRNLVRALVSAYAKYNGVSDVDPDKNFQALIGIEEQLINARAELNSRV